MRLFAIMLALLSLQWFEGRVLVSADVATATSYGPPYTRKYLMHVVHFVRCINKYLSLSKFS